MFCDHTSVGILVWKNEKLLLIERKKPPFGFAPPAGHVDDRLSFEEAARAELFEEVGLSAERLVLVGEGRKENLCRRPNGTWHFWKIYVATVKGDIVLSDTETKSFLWCTRNKLCSLKKRTDDYLNGRIIEIDWQKSPGLEPVWAQWFQELNCFDTSLS